MKVQPEGFRLRIPGGYAIARALPLPFKRRHFRHRYGTDLLVERALRSVPREVVSQFDPIIGGAVITQEYADEIGADGYSKDAADAVKLAKSLM